MSTTYANGVLLVKLQSDVPPAEPIEISEEYVAASVPLVKEQLAKAAVRVTKALDSALYD